MTNDFDYKIAMKKVNRLNDLLEKKFGLRLDFSSSRSHLKEVEDHYRNKRNQLLAEHGVAPSLAREDYAKAVLISEAISLYLREIAPKRTRSRKERK